MKKIEIKGLIVYTTYQLHRLNLSKLSILKLNPKEKFILFSNIVSVSTSKNLPANWISIKLKGDEKIYYEDKSISSFNTIAFDNGHVFQKIRGDLSINLSLAKYKNNYTTIELSNGDLYEVSRNYRNSLKQSLKLLWID